MTKRGPYKPKKSVELEAIEARRIAGGFTVDELAMKAGINRATYYRIRQSGRAFTRRIKALQMALRTLEGERRREGDVFPFAVPSRGGGASGNGSAAGSKGSRT